METIYCIANQKQMSAYVGRTNRMVGERWSEHIWGAWKGKTESKLAEAIRHAPEDFEFLVLEQSDTASEAKWMEQLKSEGWTLLNETGGNRRPPKKRDTAKEREWRAVNARANGALAAKENGGKTVHELTRDELQGLDSWGRFAAARPDYIATLAKEVELLRERRRPG